MTNTENTPPQDTTATCEHCRNADHVAIATVSRWADGIETVYRVCEPCLPSVREFATIAFDADGNAAPVDTPADTILDRIHSYITRYVAFSEPAQADVLALFVLHTHSFDYARTTPYLYITSAEKQSGKTRTLEVLETVCRAAQKDDSATSATMFRMIQALKPTLMIDEVDTIFSGSKKEDLRGVLNSGYKAGGRVPRAIGNPNDEDGGIVFFNTFCPKVLSGIDNGQVPDTVLDRCIRIQLRRKAAGQTVEDFFVEDIEDEIADLTDAIGAWVAANSDALADRTQRPPRIDGIGDRANEISRPLLALAARCRGWNTRARNSLKTLLGEDELKLSPQARALLAVRNWFDSHPDQDHIPSSVVSTLADANGKQVGTWMTAYGVKSFGTTRNGQRYKAFRRDDFADAFTRYLPARD